jgi:hypothetical protein
MKLGIDIGRVLISPDAHGTGGDTSFIGGSIQDALDTPPYEGMFDVVPALVQLFKGQVWLVSKCGPRVQEKSRLWLRHQGFFERTGIAPDNLRFCLERPQKAGHCSELGITHFIDDRPDVLRCMHGIVDHRYLFGPQKTPGTPGGMVAVPAWSDALALIRSSLPATLK